VTVITPVRLGETHFSAVHSMGVIASATGRRPGRRCLSAIHPTALHPTPESHLHPARTHSVPPQKSVLNAAQTGRQPQFPGRPRSLLGATLTTVDIDLP
jgi:hypothetical protein